MTAPNHIAGGIVFTGIFAAFTDVNILEKPEYIAITILASLIPDIDHTKSTIGKIVYPLAKLINQRYGHRTITHTLLALFLSSLAIGLIENGFNLDENYSKLWFFGFLSHLIFDMMTVQGVPLFFPFAKNPCVLPANPERRFRTGNLRSETMIFSFFLLSAVFCQPLMENGFWLQFNRSFGTVTHLYSQFKKTENLLRVDYSYRNGSESKSGFGYCVESLENESVIVAESKFIKLGNQTALTVFPTKTDSLLKFRTESFVNISLDSLERIMKSEIVKSCEIYSNSKFEIVENNVSKIASKYVSKYPNSPNFILIKAEKEVQKTFKNNPRIQSIKSQISTLESLETRNIEDWKRHLKRIKRTETAISETNDLIEKERLFDELQELEKKKEPISKREKIADLKRDLDELIKSNNNNRSDFYQSNSVQEIANTTFTGTITKIIIK